jgi:hypothetical protein
MTTGRITITARRPRAGGLFHFWPNAVEATVSVDGGPEHALPWGEAIELEVELGEHDVVINPTGPRPTLDTCCWVDEEGVRLEYVTAYRRSLRWDRIRYLEAS